MIPVRLYLKNFMCYHEHVPVLDFEGIHVGCMSGDNGHGKSALLDAMTWALWGKARARSDDELIYMWEKDMEVQFDFDVGPDRYRVIRKRSRGSLKRPGQSVLELQAASSNGFSTLSGSTIRDTERKIVELLRMDYDTFINSALLLQGRADEFSTRRPGERKQVLASVLGLSMYDNLEKLARSRSRDSDVRQKDLAGDIARIDAHLEQKGQCETRLAETQETLDGILKRLESDEAALMALRNSREEMKARLAEAEQVAKRIKDTEGQIRYLENQVTELGKQIGGHQCVVAEHDQNEARVRKDLQQVEQLEQGLEDKRKLIEEWSNRVHQLQAANAKLREEMDDLKKRVDLLKEEAAQCPLCGTVLGDEGRRRLLERYQSEGVEKGDAFRANRAEIEEKEQRLKLMRSEVDKLQSEARNQRSRCERHLEALEKDRREAETRLPQARESLGKAEEAREGLRSALKSDIERRDSILKMAEGLPNLEKRLEKAEKEYQDLKKQERECTSVLSDLQATLRLCQKMEVERSEKRVALTRAAEDKSIYDELALAFGKKGVQAMIIESVLPEIEEETNWLLGRMTDNRMHVKLESQKDTAKGETVETLEIRISDELGTRSYEMFSGGEAFRVNFALRIALSKLLARRAGAPLPTIIIDEGFGTQDSTGRERLVESIRSIQDDFEKILVITHIDELKDAFPVRIDVTKTEDGSTFSMS